MDPHSHARPNEAVIEHLDLDIRVDMAEMRIAGTATFRLRNQGADSIVFDTDGLTIEQAWADDASTAFSLGDSTHLGRPLSVAIAPTTRQVRIAYHTGTHARALQWLKPHQTSGGVHPFLFTQGQPILTRSWIPVQDSPGIRFTYTARVQVPGELMALMSAANPQAPSTDGIYTFRMDQPIPAYLMALAVGELRFQPIGPRTGVYAEPSMVAKAAWEFADAERMLEVAEGLYGPYRWERYDILVLPPSFPFGGMENPRLTFATPTILAGDRSLTALVAHELAHSWSGNLVTNGTWNDIWLNEGFTVYFENRIIEAVYGQERARMEALIGHQELLATIDQLTREGRLQDTHLYLQLEGRDPDDGTSQVAYEKGFAFLRLLEAKVGRPRFDAFLRKYFEEHAFQSMTTDRFIAYLRDELLAPEGITIDIDAWVHGPGLPADVVVPVSDRLVKVEAEVKRWSMGTPEKDLLTAGWTTPEWLHFLRHLPQPVPQERLTALDKAFRFTATGNVEVLTAWLELCIAADYAPAYDRLTDLLVHVGRRKFLVPLYKALLRTEKGRIMAQAIYQRARPNYHPVAMRTLDELLAWRENSPPVNF